MLKPTIMIQKKKIFNKRGWNRYYTQAKINLNEINFVTEKNLCQFIYEKFGEGHFMIFAWKMGRKGFWVFWKGTIEKDGFKFQKKDNVDTKELKQLKEEYEREDNAEYRKYLAETINAVIEDNKGKYYGFVPWLKPSGRRGEFIFWEDG